MSKVDKLKERISLFVKESTSETTLKIPYRVVCGFKLDIIPIIIQDLLRDKYRKEYKFVDYVTEGNDYVYNFIVLDK